MKDNATSAVKVTYHSSCLDEDPLNLKQTNKCDGLKVGTLVKFYADIEVSYLVFSHFHSCICYGEVIV